MSNTLEHTWTIGLVSKQTVVLRLLRRGNECLVLSTAQSISLFGHRKEIRVLGRLFDTL